MTSIYWTEGLKPDFVSAQAKFGLEDAGEWKSVQNFMSPFLGGLCTCQVKESEHLGVSLKCQFVGRQSLERPTVNFHYSTIMVTQLKIGSWPSESVSKTTEGF